MVDDACGPYGHDIHLQEICAAWKRPPVTEMSVQEHREWIKVEQQLLDLKKQKDLEQMQKFRELVIKPKRNKPFSIENKTNGDELQETAVTKSQTEIQNPFSHSKGKKLFIF